MLASYTPALEALELQHHEQTQTAEPHHLSFRALVSPSIRASNFREVRDVLIELEKGGNPSPKDSQEQTPWWLTADKGQNSVIMILLEAADRSIPA